MATLQEKIDKASQLGLELEKLLLQRGQITRSNTRDVLLLAHWSLIFDYDKGVMVLLSKELYGSAFALLRPTIEALLRAHVVVSGSDDDVNAIKDGRYRVNFATIGAKIDPAYGANVFDNVLKGAIAFLHSMTHSSVAQLSRQLDERSSTKGYTESEISMAINYTSNAAFLVTNLVTKHFKLTEDDKRASDLFMEWS